MAAAGLLALGLLLSSSPPRADAYSADYCGALIASSMPPTWRCYSSFARLTYSSARYGGGGNIQRLYTGLSTSGADRYGVGYNATFVSFCLRTAVSGYGVLTQYDGTARHTIYGHVDDSPNHTGCAG